jgi:hypothetical protein
MGDAWMGAAFIRRLIDGGLSTAGNLPGRNKDLNVVLPALFGNAGFDGCKGLFFAQKRGQLIAFTIISLRHISSLGGFSDNGILHGHILLFRLDIVGRECYF